MKDFNKRIDRLEGALGAGDKIDPIQECLMKRIEAARQRMGMKAEPAPKHTSYMSLAERLKAAREALKHQHNEGARAN